MDPHKLGPRVRTHDPHVGTPDEPPTKPDLGTAWPPNIVRRPPHLSQEDYKIWQAWYPTLTIQPKTLYFDVAVGNGKEIPFQQLSNPYYRAWIRNTRRRIDALFLFPTKIWIVELRYLAAPSAIGECGSFRAGFPALCGLCG